MSAAADLHAFCVAPPGWHSANPSGAMCQAWCVRDPPIPYWHAALTYASVLFLFKLRDSDGVLGRFRMCRDALLGSLGWRAVLVAFQVIRSVFLSGKSVCLIYQNCTCTTHLVQQERSGSEYSGKAASALGLSLLENAFYCCGSPGFQQRSLPQM